MVSSAPEYARFLQMILDGGSYRGARILPSAAVEEMLSDQTGGARLVFSPMAANPSLRDARYGIGVWREVSDSASGRAIEVSSPGAFGFIPWIDRDRGLVGVLTMRGMLRNAMPTYVTMKRIIRETIPARPVARPEPHRPARVG
jgi:CubicO group peptidase (beta-lactamase class C family)